MSVISFSVIPFTLRSGRSDASYRAEPCFRVSLKNLLQRTHAETVRVADEQCIVCLHSFLHIAQDVIQVELVSPCSVPSLGRDAEVGQTDGFNL